MFYGRSSAEIDDDTICETHDSVCKHLSERGSYGYVFQGRSRDRLLDLKAWLEKAIEGSIEANARDVFYHVHEAYRGD